MNYRFRVNLCGFKIAVTGLMAIMFLVIAAGCGQAVEENTPTPRPVPTPNVTAEEKEQVVIAELNWDSAAIQAYIATFIVRNGYGYPVDIIAGDTISIQQALISGDVDLVMEIWLPNQREALEQPTAEGTVVYAGRSLDDNWQSMFVIPRYVQEQNPNLKSIEDLEAHSDLFVTSDSNGKARLVTCVPGWACEVANAEKYESYGLGEYVELISPGSAAALFADLEGAYRRGEPWIGYLWGPTKPATELDLVVLEEAPYTVECWESDKKCGYPTAEIKIATHKSLVARAPEVIEFLNDWSFSADEHLATEAWLTDNNEEYENAAVWYLQNYRERWTSFVPVDVVERIDNALEIGF